MKARQGTGYSSFTARKYIDLDSEFVVLTIEGDPSFVWKDGERTDEINGYNYWFIENDGVEPLKVKFAKKLTALSFLDHIHLVGLVAVEVNRNVYFKADGVK